MNHARNNRLRALAIYPYRRGFGFAVLESSQLVDWGLARQYSKSDEEFIVRVEWMIRRYEVNAIVVEQGMNSRRSEHAKRKVARLALLAMEMHVRYKPVSGAAVRGVVGLDVDATNHDVSARLAAYLPELAVLLPSKRKFYEPEDDRSIVFRAVGLAVAALCA